MSDNNTIICSNCGAEIPADAAVCPYCGAINEKGSEKQYMNKLEDIREDVEELSDDAAVSYKAEMKKSTRIFIVTVSVIAAAVLLLFAFKYIRERMAIGVQSDSDLKEQMAWERENFPKLDELYEKKDYKSIIKYLDDPDHGTAFYDWKHAEFIHRYGSYSRCLDNFAAVSENRAEEQDIVYYISDAVYFTEDTDYSYLDKEEKSLVVSYQDEISKMLESVFLVTPEEAAQIYQDSLDEKDHFFVYDKCDKASKPYCERYQKSIEKKEKKK